MQNYDISNELRIKSEEERIRRLYETDEQRERRLSRAQNNTVESVVRRHKLLLEFQVEMCKELYETIRNYKTEEGRLICKSFIRAPNRWSLADYYDIVTKPIDLLKIHQKLQANEYKDSQQLESDVELLVNNAKSYYKEDSQEYRDACELRKVFSDAKILKEKNMMCEIKTKEAILKRDAERRKVRSETIKRKSQSRLQDGTEWSSLPDGVHDADSTDTETEDEDVEDDLNGQSNKQWLLYKAVKNYESDCEKLSKLFWNLPSWRCYPDYYKEIKKPISLSRISANIKQCKYPCPLKLVADMNLMFKYAKMYNKSESKIFKAAIILEKIVKDKAKELNLRPVKKKAFRTYLERKKPETPSVSEQGTIPGTYEILLYICQWDNCNQTFENIDDLADHTEIDIRQTYLNRPSEKFECKWPNCQRTKKNFQPLSSLHSVIRHVKNQHLKLISKNTVPQINKEAVNQPNMDYVFESECKCNFSDMQVYSDTTDSCNTGTVIKCMLCPATKVRRMAAPSTVQQVTTIKQEPIDPEDGTNQSSIDPNSNPVRVEMMFNVDQDQITTGPGRVSYDRSTAMGVTAETLKVCVPTRTYTRKLFTKSRIIHKNSTSSENDTSGGHLQPYARPPITMQMRELPNYPKSLLVGKKKTCSYSPPQTFSPGDLRKQPVVAQQVSANLQLQHSVNNQVLVPVIGQLGNPLIDLPLVTSIKEELILPD